MPAIRRPLRERCNISLSVFTSATYDSALESPLRSADPEPIRGRRRARVRKPTAIQVKSKKHATKSEKARSPLHPLIKGNDHGLQSLHELIPGLFVAFSTAELGQDSNDLSSFTHVVNITHPTTTHKAGRTELEHDDTCGRVKLHLTIPTSVMPQRGRRRARTGRVRDTTLLTQYQLLAARDFLSLALPYYAQAHPIDDAFYLHPTPADAVRLLIIAPLGDGAAADIMSIAVCYLAFASEEGVETVLKYIDEENEVMDIWQDAIGVDEGGVEFVESVAMMGV